MKWNPDRHIRIPIAPEMCNRQRRSQSVPIGGSGVEEQRIVGRRQTSGRSVENRNHACFVNAIDRMTRDSDREVGVAVVAQIPSG